VLNRRGIEVMQLIRGVVPYDESGRNCKEEWFRRSMRPTHKIKIADGKEWFGRWSSHTFHRWLQLLKITWSRKKFKWEGDLLGKSQIEKGGRKESRSRETCVV
jgi:hypothetical protein